MLFALLSGAGAAVFFWSESKKTDLSAPFVSIEAAILLPALVLFLSIAASNSWAGLLSKERTKVEHTRRAAWLGAGACAVVSSVSIFLHG